MVIYALCQKGDTSHWTAQYIKGIKEETKRKGHELKCIECSLDPSEFISEVSLADAAIVISGTYSWTRSICNLLSNECIKPIVVGYDHTNDINATGYVLMDYKKAIYDILDYFTSTHRTRVALFAVSLESPADKIKTDAFLSYTKPDGQHFEQKDIFYFRGMTKSTCESFISVCSDYDAVIGTNDVSTVILIQMLKSNGIKVPEDIFIVTFADTSLSKSTTNELTLALLDCKGVGVQAAKMCVSLSKARNISSSVIRLGCTIDVSNSTANIPHSSKRSLILTDYKNEHNSMFFADPHINEIVLAEKVLEKCDTIDLEILHSLIKNEKYIDVADRLHVSENTVKYRIKRLLNLANLDSRSKLTELMKDYLK